MFRRRRINVLTTSSTLMRHINGMCLLFLSFFLSFYLYIFFFSFIVKIDGHVCLLKKKEKKRSHKKKKKKKKKRSSHYENMPIQIY